MKTCDLITVSIASEVGSDGEMRIHTAVEIHADAFYYVVYNVRRTAILPSCCACLITKLPARKVAHCPPTL